jgi:hypothetical protein
MRCSFSGVCVLVWMGVCDLDGDEYLSVFVVVVSMEPLLLGLMFRSLMLGCNRVSAG